MLDQYLNNDFNQEQLMNQSKALGEIRLANVLNFLYNFEKNKEGQDKHIKREDIAQAFDNALEALSNNY